MEKTLAHYSGLSWRDLTESDIVFLRKNGVVNGCGGGGSKWYEKAIQRVVRMTLVALTFYIAVRIFGRFYFNYKK